MAKPRRKLRLSEPISTRDLILEEAMRIIARQGVEELRIKDLAGAVGIQPPSVYRHFINREAIISALAEQLVEEMARFLNPDPALGPREWMQAWVRSLVWFYATRPAYMILILREIATPGGVEPMESALGPPEEAFTRGPLRETSQAFEEMYDRGVEQGVLRPTDHRHVSAMLNGAVLSGLAWPYGGGRKDFPPTAGELMRLQDDAVAIFQTLTDA